MKGLQSGKRTKIVCTIGPATRSPETMERLARAGMDCARLNFSHGTTEVHEQYIKNIRKVSSGLGRHIAIMQDLPGPKFRVGRLKNGVLHLRKDSRVTMVDEAEYTGDEATIPVNYRRLSSYISAGSTVHLSDGLLRLRVEQVSRGEIRCKCESSGDLLSGKGINIPKLKHTFEAFTEQDRSFLKFGLEQGVDMVAVSFVRTAKDIEAVKSFIGGRSGAPLIVAKIEKKDAVENLPAIAGLADTIMVARGDLGVENPIENVPIIQKTIIAHCNSVGVPVITATQMLESMVTNPTPTRAEVTDIANAILDGTDALMLSEETATGKFPVECVEVLKKVSLIAEEKVLRDGRSLRARTGDETVLDALSEAAAHLADKVQARLLVSLTDSVRTASKISRFRPRAPIVAFTESEAQTRKFSLVWGVFPMQQSKGSLLDHLNSSVASLRDAWSLKEGDRLVMVSDKVRLSGHDGEMLFVAEVGKTSRPN